MDCSYGSCCNSTTHGGIICEQRALTEAIDQIPEEGAWQIDQVRRAAIIYHEQKLTIHQQLALIEQLKDEIRSDHIKLFTFLYKRPKQGSSIEDSQPSSNSPPQPPPQGTTQQQKVLQFQPQNILFVNGGQIPYPHLHANSQPANIGDPLVITLQVVEVPESPLMEGRTLINRDSLIAYTSFLHKPTFLQMNLHCHKVLQSASNSRPPRRFIFLIERSNMAFNLRSSLVLKELNRLILLRVANFGKSNVKMVESYLQVENYFKSK